MELCPILCPLCINIGIARQQLNVQTQWQKVLWHGPFMDAEYYRVIWS
jgi:hypothetical protein